MEQKSTFVTVVAWIFIVLSGFGVLMLVMDTAIFWTFPFDRIMEQTATLNPHQPQLPAEVMTAIVRWVLVVMLLIQVWVLASSIGLLQRKNWARISFIVLMVIGLVWNGLYLLFGILGTVGIHFVGNMATAPGMPGMQAFMQTFMVMFVIFDIVMLVLLGWLLKKLVSENIRKEFEKPAAKPGALAA